jgi:metal-responsive CopG/Arc/MetJ family transcriptional regulator
MQIPLNPQGGAAVRVQVILPDSDVARLHALAARRRKKSRSAVARELIAEALDRAEIEQQGVPA